MLNVVFSDSLKGAMKQRKLQNVVEIGFHLDVGDIQGGINGEQRQNVFHQLWGHVPFSKQEKAQFFQNQKEDYDQLMEAASQNESIRIWTSDAPGTICGLYYVCDLLENMDCPIYIVQLPKFIYTKEHTLANYRVWEEVNVEEYRDFLSLEKQITPLEKAYMANCWKTLKKENASLRAMINGRLCSVPNTFYDFLINEHIPDEEFVMAQLIGTILGTYELGISDGFLAGRIQEMIKNGLLTIIKEDTSEHPYGSILKKNIYIR